MFSDCSSHTHTLLIYVPNLATEEIAVITQPGFNFRSSVFGTVFFFFLVLGLKVKYTVHSTQGVIRYTRGVFACLALTSDETAVFH